MWGRTCASGGMNPLDSGVITILNYHNIDSIVGSHPAAPQHSRMVRLPDHHQTLCAAGRVTVHVAGRIADGVCLS
eukprot:COSAG02_NODE_9443_length_2214_cov_28.215603_1_plen_74_part_10